MSFKYLGSLPSSKSLYNRLLIVKSFFPDFKIHGHSESEDIEYLKKSVTSFSQGHCDFFLGEGGTGLRFLMSRLSRETGNFTLRAHPRLLERPHSDLIYSLEKLGAQIIFHQQEQKYSLHSTGWKKPTQPLFLNLKTSSQFASSLLLSSWNLPFDLELILIDPSMEKDSPSSYFKMTLCLLKSLGLKVEVEIEDKDVEIEDKDKTQNKDQTQNQDRTQNKNQIQNKIKAEKNTRVTFENQTIPHSHNALPDFGKGKVFLRIPKNQSPVLTSYIVEPDWSCLATMILASQINGYLETPFHSSPLQPDSIIVDFVKKMGGPLVIKNASTTPLESEDHFLQDFSVRDFSVQNTSLKNPSLQDPSLQQNFSLRKSSVRESSLLVSYRGSQDLKPLQASFDTCPDLVPCMAALCAFAKGPSILRDLNRLAYKESHRLLNTLTLLKQAGVPYESNGQDFIKIYGQGSSWTPQSFCFDPDQDHRMAMAAGLLKLRNPSIRIQNPEVVNKSFQNFWSLIGVQP
jgi:5-enolpyruvylshikimate-3-phosphate synthase